LSLSKDHQVLRFLVDESTGRAVARYLQEAGYDVIAVSEEMPQADDDQIIERALSEARILVTNDKDFGEKVFRDRRSHAGILLLRLSDERAANKVRVVQAVIAQHAEQLPNNFVVASEYRVRIRTPL